MTSPEDKIHKLRRERDTCRAALGEIAKMVGFKKSDRPKKQELLSAIQKRINPETLTFQLSEGASGGVHATSTAEVKGQQNTIIQFKLTQHRFGAAKDSGSGRFSDMQRLFPSNIPLTAGTHFFGDGGTSYRILGFLPRASRFGVACCAADKLENPNYIFKGGDLCCYSTDYVLAKVAGPAAAAQFTEERVDTYASKYGISTKARSAEGVKLSIGGRVRRVRVNDINVHKRNRPIGVVELHGSVKPGQKWWVAAKGLAEAHSRED